MTNILKLIGIFLISFTCLAGSGTTTLTAPTSFMGSSTKWEKLGNYIIKSDYKTYVINWKGRGGLNDNLNGFLWQIHKAKTQGKIIVLNMVGTSYSAHADALCYASKIINKNNNQAMYHMSTSTINDTYRYFNLCKKKGIITENQIKQIHSGKEIYVVPKSN